MLHPLKSLKIQGSRSKLDHSKNGTDGPVGVVVSRALERTMVAVGTLLSNRPWVPVRHACRVGRGFPSCDLAVLALSGSYGDEETAVDRLAT